MMDRIQGLNSIENQDQTSSVSSAPAVSKAKEEAYGAKTTQKELVNAKKAFEDLAKKLEDFQKVVKTNFKYEILKNPDMIVLKIMNSDTGEVVRQIPPKEAVRLAKAIDELMGLFVDKHV
jgi:flagellar protein FlaG